MTVDDVTTVDSRVDVASSAQGDNAATLLRRASGALAEAKESETGAVRVRDSAGAEDAAIGDRLEIDLRRALDKDEIEIVFQPQVSVTSGDIVGVEALARWRHPGLGELGAPTLFNAAERSDYLVQLSDHVQKKAIAAAAAWPAALAGLPLSVNITAPAILRPGFPAQLRTRGVATHCNHGPVTGVV